MTSIRIACLALSASALFLGGMLFQSFTAPAIARAATVNWGGSTTVLTAKLQQGEDGLYVLSGDTLSLYRNNVSAKKLELLTSQKVPFEKLK